jgi:hypothetical protein
VIENTIGVLHNTLNKSEHTPRGIIHFRFYDVTTCDVTSNPVAILLPVMRNDTFYINTIVRTKRGKLTSLPVTWLPFMPHPLAMLLPVMHNCTFRTTAMVKKRGTALPDMCRTYFRLWRHFRSHDFMWRHLRSGPLPVTSLPVTHTQLHAPLCSPRNIPWAVPIHYFDIWTWGTLWITHEQISKDGIVLSHLGFNSKI